MSRNVREIERVEGHLSKSKGPVLQRKTARREWIVRESICQKLLVTHYGLNRDGLCEWLGSKKDLLRLYAMEDLAYFTKKVAARNVPTVLSGTSDSGDEAGGLTVLKEK